MAEKISEIVQDDTKDMETVMKHIDQIDTKIKFKAFGKTKPKQKKPGKHNQKMKE